MDKIKLTANILFSGVGFQERGFLDSGLFDIDVLATSDIDKDAILTYAGIHNGLTQKLIDNFYGYPSIEDMIAELSAKNIGYDPKKQKVYDWYTRRKQENFIKKYWLAVKVSNNLGDISRIKELPKADFWSCSFPCQSISVAGKCKGFNPDSGTRSSLLWENIRLLKDAVDKNQAPMYVMFENVKNLVGKQFYDDFMALIEILDILGFNTYWKVLNAKECGIPQNRERVFAICIRKDIDKHQFKFPEPFDNGIRLQDWTEEQIDERYYIKNQRAESLIDRLLDEGKLKQLGFSK